MAEKIFRVDPFPPSPSGRKAATSASIDLDDYAPSFNNFTTDRQCLAEYEVDTWDPAVIGAKGAYKGFEAAAQSPGGKRSRDRVSY